MKKILQLASFVLIAFTGVSQADNCSFATSINVNPTCVPVSGSTIGMTQNLPGCSGNADDDVWYQFTASATSQQIIVTAGASFDPVVQLFSGSCASLVSIICKDDGGNGVTETINATGLSIGQVYRFRIYHYGAGAGSGDFTVCVANPPSAPSNNNCAGAVTLPVNTTCSYTSGTTDGATQSQSGCAGNADDDVWYKFVATNSVQTVTVNPIDNIDLVVQVFSGSCAGLTSLNCTDNTFSSEIETVNLVGLIPGQTYFIRVYDYYAGNSGDFQICVTGAATAAPSNDEACNAIQIPEVTSSCQYLQFTTVGSTASLTAPTPSSCVGGSAPQQGGFSSSSHDVWFAITVPSTGNITIMSEPNIGAGAITDGVMVLYSGTCSTLSQIACSDDNSSYPGSSNDLLPIINASGLTPGSTVFLRYFGYGSSQGTFGFCVSTATNDNCVNALYICDINGYSASTSAAYTADRPCNMFGNNETSAGVNQPDGINTGGIFGQAGPWGTGSPAFDVIINNNSWIKFTAASTTATLQVDIYDCWVGNYPSGGIQMQIFSGTNCCSFVPVSNFEESSTGFVITANNLTVGSDYYLMVDGYAGDICNYTITAESGVQFPDIANVAPICQGQSTSLTAPAGATSYYWEHDGSTTQSVTVSPSTTQTYICEVTGLCGYKQTLDATVTVIPNPTVSITNGPNVAICAGQSVTLSATGASTYSWSSGQNGSSINVSPLSATSYTVTGTTSGCTATANTTVSINALPTLSVNPTSNDADCGASNGSLTGASGSGAPTLSYNWINGSGTTVGSASNLTGIPAGTYFLNLTDGNGCSNQFGPFSVVNPGAPTAPTIAVNDATPCLGTDVTLTGNHPDGSATYTWSGPSGFNSSSSTINLLSVDNTDQGNYCVYVTVSGCSGPSTCQNITINALPTLTLSVNDTDSIICLNESAVLSVSGASTYAWTGPSGFSSTGASVNLNSVTSSSQGYYIVIATDANGCSSSDSIYISVAALPNLTLNSTGQSNTFCEDATIGLSATGATSYSWNGPNSFTSSNNAPVILNANEANEGWYYVDGTDALGCHNADSLFITVNTDIPANSSPSDTLICPGEGLTLSASGGITYDWSGPAGFASDQATVVLSNMTIEQSGWYVVVVSDAFGCSAADSSNILVQYNSDCIFIPTLATPDQDGHNDYWEINGIESYPQAEVEIYNRWGTLIYFASPYNNDWDGSVNRGSAVGGNDGKVPVGTYFYVIRLNDDANTVYNGYIEVQY